MRSTVNAGEQGGMHDLNLNIFRNGANSGRLEMGQIDPRVHELGMEVLNMTVSGLRWAVFGFNSRKNKIIPLTAAPATADWEKDFKMFTNALPEYTAAVGVYNFEYWVDQDTTGVEPIMITWAPKCVILDDEVSARRRRHSIGAQKKGYAPVPDIHMYSGPYRLDSISDMYSG